MRRVSCGIRNGVCSPVQDFSPSSFQMRDAPTGMNDLRLNMKQPSLKNCEALIRLTSTSSGRRFKDCTDLELSKQRTERAPAGRLVRT